MNPVAAVGRSDLDLEQQVDRASRQLKCGATLNPVTRRLPHLRLATITLLLAAGIGASPSGAAQVRVFGSDGRQIDAVDAQNAGQGISTVRRASRGGGQNTTTATTCAAEATTQAFAALGDLADYALAPAGDFESRTDGWNLNDATVVAGNEDVGILRGSRSLLIGVRGERSASAYSPDICVDPSKPTFRFLFRAAQPGTSVLTTLRFHPKGDSRLTVEVDSASNAATSDGWTVAEPNELATKIAAQLMNDTGTVEIGFEGTSPNGDTARVQIDDLLIDPYRRG